MASRKIISHVDSSCVNPSHGSGDFPHVWLPFGYLPRSGPPIKPYGSISGGKVDFYGISSAKLWKIIVSIRWLRWFLRMIFPVTTPWMREFPARHAWTRTTRTSCRIVWLRFVARLRGKIADVEIWIMRVLQITIQNVKDLYLGLQECSDHPNFSVLAHYTTTWDHSGNMFGTWRVGVQGNSRFLRTHTHTVEKRT